MAKRVYRKRNNSDCWHFMENCSNWPTKDYKELISKPKNGEFCDQCMAKSRKVHK